VGSPRLNRHALSVSAVAAFLAGCGGSQPSIGVPGAVTQSLAIATHAERGGSWTLPEAKSGDLLYATSADYNQVYVLSYPQLAFVGRLTGFDFPVDVCPDTDGDVWIVDYRSAEVVEYANGGTTPIATLSTQDFPTGCAVDPSTGNLAVLENQNEISIFPNAQNPPTTYTASSFSYLQFGTYDDRGNFFSVGFVGGLFSAENELAELPKAGNGIVAVPFNQEVDGNVVQWDGKHLAVGAGQFHGQPLKIYQVSVSDGSANLVGTLQLKVNGKREAGQQFWVQGHRLILGPKIWRYPHGGAPVNDFENVAHDIWSDAVSQHS
jgi:hypothetical protein